jgi:L-amino acid N-acyltransferase YncA
MAKAFVKIVPVLGYKASVFNLVFANNPASIRIWKELKFQEVGRKEHSPLILPYHFILL